MSIELVMPSNHLILCRPLLLLPSVFPSIRVFSNESVPRIRWPKYWNFSFSISSSNEYSGLISFRIDWFDLLGEQGTLKSLLQHHSSKASILQCLAFFIVQLSHPYMTTGKTVYTHTHTHTHTHSQSVKEDSKDRYQNVSLINSGGSDFWWFLFSSWQFAVLWIFFFEHVLFQNSTKRKV